MTISPGEYFCGIPLPAVRSLNHIITNYIRWIVICYGRQYYGNVFMIPLPRYFTVLIVLSTSPMCYHYDEMLNFTFQNISATFSNSTPISITCIMKPPLLYNFINLFKLLLVYTAVQHGNWSVVMNLSFLVDVIMNAFILKSITFGVSVTNLCIL